MKSIAICFGALAAAASAHADVTVNLGSALLAGNQMVSHLADLSGTCTGITMSVGFRPDAAAMAHESWCSDGAVVVIPPSGSGGSQWGGDVSTFPHVTVLEGNWTFDGPGSALPGVYTNSAAAANANLTGSGSWTVGWGNSWSESTPVQYENITVTLHGVIAVPASGSAVIMGAGGLLAARRRRVAQ